MEDNKRRYIHMISAVILADLKKKELPKDSVKKSIEHLNDHFEEIWENINARELINSFR